MAPDLSSGTYANGMDYLVLGAGTKRMLFLMGGPGGSVPSGVWLRMAQRRFAPYLDAGYQVWVVTRRRGMPPGHSVADMADDFAGVISDHLGGRVDLVVGESFGGMIAQYLAARHPGLVGRVALVATGAEVSDWGKDVDQRLAAALRRGDRNAAGAAVLEYVIPLPSLVWLRRLGGPLVANWLQPLPDVLVEVDAELAFDARGVLADISVPVLLVCGDRDRFFPRSVVADTAARIADCALVWYAGKGHVQVALSRKVTSDVLAFAARAA